MERLNMLKQIFWPSFLLVFLLTVNVNASASCKWGLIDKTGKIVVQPQYDSIGRYDGKYASFMMDGKWGLIDQAGKVIVRPGEYDFLELFFNGLARVQLAGKWGYINQAGEVYIKPKYDDSSIFFEGIAL
jgi:hypothetical protein